MKTYRRKTKIIGRKEFTDNETGEIISLNVVQVEERDFNFEKLWVGHIIQALDIIGNKKTKIIFHIIQNRNRDNIFIGTYRELEKKMKISLQTIAETFKALLDNDFLVMVQQGVYRLNPNIIFKGTQGNRIDILIRYQNEKAEAEKNKDKEEEMINPMEYINSELEEAEKEAKEAQKRLEKIRRKKQELTERENSEQKEKKAS